MDQKIRREDRPLVLPLVLIPSSYSHPSMSLYRNSLEGDPYSVKVNTQPERPPAGSANFVSQIWQLYERSYGDYTSGNNTSKPVPLLGLHRSSSPSHSELTQTRYSSTSLSLSVSHSLDLCLCLTMSRTRKQSGIKIRG
jgi:hypothetical protein